MTLAQVKDAKLLLEREGYKLIDVRSAREYDEAHLTKPPRTCFNVPYQSGGEPQFVQGVEALCRSKEASKVMVACADGGLMSTRKL